ncbi:DUF805 domain-containing protein [Pectinatus frisingensis]|uniref:DUF805 domain-containing protein n=1 Tax=Pectinatus frisingensis TaxID=865 RepID=UPI0018C60FAC|nr:DUF805 domain-containing protein [Pectinatus frisingensis]
MEINISDISKLYFSTHGRLNRKPYLIRRLKLFIGPVVLLSIIANVSKINILYEIFETLFLILIMLLFVSTFMLSVRRLHDLNHSGWFTVFMVIPILSLIINVYMLFFSGTNGANDYGNDPLEEHRQEREQKVTNGIG